MITKRFNKLGGAFAIMLLISASGCDSKPSPTSEPKAKEPNNDTTAVSVTVAGKAPFNNEIVTNGTLRSTDSYELYSPGNYTVEYLYAGNGDIVKQGKEIVKLSTNDLDEDIARAEIEVNSRYLEYLDILIGQGTDEESANDRIKDMAKLKSGLMLAEQNLNYYRKKKEALIVVAPISGVISDLNLRKGSMIGQNSHICTIFNPSSMEMIFSVLESEAFRISKGTHVIGIITATGSRIDGVVSRINPVVTSGGTVSITAKVTSAVTTDAMDGMNVNLVVEYELSKAIAIPKSAIVNRNGSKVVFTIQDRKAYWNYVSCGAENTSSIVITDGLSEGDTVIIDNNSDLIHKSPVRVL